MHFEPDKWSCDVPHIPYGCRYDIMICHKNDKLKTFETTGKFQVIGKKVSKCFGDKVYFFSCKHTGNCMASKDENKSLNIRIYLAYEYVAVKFKIFFVQKSFWWNCEIFNPKRKN